MLLKQKENIGTVQINWYIMQIHISIDTSLEYRPYAFNDGQSKSH